MDQKITPLELRNLYIPSDRDEHIFELSEDMGLQIVRKYSQSFPKLAEERMFIKFYIKDENGIGYVHGGVDIVKKSESNDSQWVIQYPEGILFHKRSNFNFWKSEDIHFDYDKKLVIFKGTEYSLNEFVDFLEKNHFRDIFLFSRLKNYMIISFLHILFFLSDTKYNKIDYIFIRGEKSSIPKDQETKIISEKADPLFHYFNIYKNLFGLTIILLLPFLFHLSILLNEKYFSVTNPLLVFIAILLLYFLEKISNLLYITLTKTDFVQKMTEKTLELKGNLKDI